MSGTLSVKNFEKFQHYTDRNPPWIKLYNALLDDYAFGALADASKAHLIAIWLLASRNRNKIPADPEWIARRINATEKVDVAALVKAGFLIEEQGCSEVLAERKQDAMPEREGQVQVEKKELMSADADPSKPSAETRKSTYPEAFEAFWRDYPTDPLMSKKKAFAHWERLSDADRIAARAAVPAFKAHCTKNPTYRAVHAERFISERRFDGFNDAKAATAALSDRPAHPSWNGTRAKVEALVGEANFVGYFATAELDIGPPTTIAVGTETIQRLVVSKFGSKLRTLFGQIEITVAKDLNA